jgi:exodeoxyribonuclease V gamma subunit
MSDAFPPPLYYSNRVERLLEALAANLVHPGTGPFTRRVIVVSSQAMEQWVRYQLAHQRSLAVLLGVEVCTVERALTALQGPGQKVSRDVLSLALCLESQIRDAVTDPDPRWEGLRRYLGLADSAGARWRQARRLVELSHQLAKLFVHYGLYGWEHVQVWTGEDTDWQKALWAQLFSNPRWRAEADVLAQLPDEVPVQEDVQYHLFGLAFLPRARTAFFQALAERVTVFTYVLSPCRAFWTDIRSDREGRWLQRFWKERGASTGQLDSLEFLLRDRNPLLANFGRLGREFHSYLEESAEEGQQCYELPAPVEGSGLYTDLVDEEVRFCPSKGPATLLQHIQADMTLLRSPEAGVAHPLHPDDHSLEVHQAPSKWREVEILYDNLLRLFGQHAEQSDPIDPHEVLVMAPNIADYAPAIEALFGAAESPLSYQLMDVDLGHGSAYLQALTDLLHLPQGRWELPSILEFLERGPVLRRLGWDAESVQTVRRWLSETGIYWGWDATQRSVLLERDACRSEVLAGMSSGTWYHGLRRLLRGLVFGSHDSPHTDIPAMEGLELGEGEVLGALYQWLSALHAWIEGALEEERTLTEWARYFEHAATEFLAADQEDVAEQRDAAMLAAVIEGIDRLAQSSEEERYGWQSIIRVFDHLAEAQGRIIQEHLFDSIRCCSLVPMRSIPARVICLLGMDKDAFPRQEQEQALNLLKGVRGVDYCPSRTDFDRYLFLEALLSARDHLFISYPAYSHEDHCALFPSTVLGELIRYADRHYSLGEANFSDSRLYSHPFSSLDAQSFLPVEQRSYSLRRYRGVQALLQGTVRSRRFLDFDTGTEEERKQLSCSEIETAVKDPLRLFCQQRLGMRLVEERELRGEEPLTVDALGRYFLRRDLIHAEAKDVLRRADGRSELPWGLLGEVASQAVEQEASDLQRHCAEWGVGREELISLTLSANCERPEQLGPTRYLLPALEIQGILITGSMRNLCSEGVLSLGKCSVEQAVRVLPRALLVERLKQQWELPFGSDLLFPRDGQRRAVDADWVEGFLPPLLQHSRRCLESPVALPAAWVQALLQGQEPRQIWEADGWQYLPYLSWAWDLSDAEDFEAWLRPAYAWAEMLYGPIVQTWFPKKKKRGA